MNILDRMVLKMFVNEYLNINDIASKLNKTDIEIENILSKYTDILTSYKIDELYVR